MSKSTFLPVARYDDTEINVNKVFYERDVKMALLHHLEMQLLVV